MAGMPAKVGTVYGVSHPLPPRHAYCQSFWQYLSLIDGLVVSALSDCSMMFAPHANLVHGVKALPLTPFI